MVGGSDPGTGASAATIAVAVLDAARSSHQVAGSIGEYFQEMMDQAVQSGHTTESALDILRRISGEATGGATSDSLMHRIENSASAPTAAAILTEYFARLSPTQTELTTTSTTQVDLLNKSTDGVFYGIVADDLDDSGDVDTVEIVKPTAWAVAESNAALSNFGIWKLERFLWEGAWLDDSGARFIFLAFQDFHVKVKCHTTPTSGIKFQMTYGDPEGSGHEQKKDVKYLMRKAIPSEKLLTVQSHMILGKLQKDIEPEIDTIRINKGRTNFSIDVECNVTHKNLANKITNINDILANYDFKKDPRTMISDGKGGMKHNRLLVPADF